MPKELDNTLTVNVMSFSQTSVSGTINWDGGAGGTFVYQQSLEVPTGCFALAFHL